MRAHRISAWLAFTATLSVVGCEGSDLQGPEPIAVVPGTVLVQMGPEGPFSSIAGFEVSPAVSAAEDPRTPDIPSIVTLATIPGRDMGGQDLIPGDGDVLSGTFTNVRNFIVAAGTTVRVAPGVPLSVSAASITIAGTLDGSGAGYPGGAVNPVSSGDGYPGAGPGGGGGGKFDPCIHGPGGGGGGHGGKGGAGGMTLSTPAEAPGGAANGSATPPGNLMGSGGGSAGNHCNYTPISGRGGAGGAGGGAITLSAPSITVSGSVVADGGDGRMGIPTVTIFNGQEYPSRVSGGAGGAGGGIWLNGGLNLTGLLSARGGAGGDAYPAKGYGTGGGGGGGGRIKLSGCTSVNTAAVAVTGGAAGANSSYESGPPLRYPQAGAEGTVSNQTTVCTPPVIVPTVTGTLGTGGWYTSDVSLSWSVTDPESPVLSSTGCGGVAVTEDTAGRTFTCSATSAGGTASVSVTIKRDATAPTVEPGLTGKLGQDGWYVSDVGISWAVQAGPSGVSVRGAGCAPTVLTSDTEGTAFTCSATSGAGLAGTGSVTVKRDAAAPLVTYEGNAGSYLVDQTVAITCSASDALSGVASSTCEDISGAAYAFDVGLNTFSASALDVAGNRGAGSTSFTVGVTPASLCTLVERLVSEKGMVNSLCAKLDAVAKARNANARGGQIQAFVNEVTAQAGKKIAEEVAELLIRLVRVL